MVFGLRVLPEHLFARILNDVVHLLDEMVKHGSVIRICASDGRDCPIVVNVLVYLGNGEVTLQLKEEAAEVARLLAASDECRAVDISVFFVEFNKLDFSVSCGCGLTELLIFTLKLCIIQIGDGPETAHAHVLGVVG